MIPVALNFGSDGTGGGGHDGNSVQYGNMTRPIGYVVLSLVVQKCSKNSTSNEVLYRTSADLEWQNISSQHATFLRFLALSKSRVNQ